MSKNTTNISGEMTETCPKCNTTGSINSSPHMIDDQNPWRTGGWVVVKDRYIRRVFNPPDLVEQVLRQRVAFVPDDAWELMGLPRGNVAGDLALNSDLTKEETHGDDSEA